MSKLSEYGLTKWRRLLLIRDAVEITVGGSKVKSGLCPMCNTVFPIWRLQAHHIYPKSIFPQWAYLLDNGIMLDMNCHMHIVHSGNSFRDVSTLHHWRMFVPMFREYNLKHKNLVFNTDNQPRLKKWTK